MIHNRLVFLVLYLTIIVLRLEVAEGDAHESQNITNCSAVIDELQEEPLFEFLTNQSAVIYADEVAVLFVYKLLENINGQDGNGIKSLQKAFKDSNRSQIQITYEISALCEGEQKNFFLTNYTYTNKHKIHLTGIFKFKKGLVKTAEQNAINIIIDMATVDDHEVLQCYGIPMCHFQEYHEDRQYIFCEVTELVSYSAVHSFL